MSTTDFTFELALQAIFIDILERCDEHGTHIISRYNFVDI